MKTILAVFHYGKEELYNTFPAAIEEISGVSLLDYSKNVLDEGHFDADKDSFVICKNMDVKESDCNLLSVLKVEDDTLLDTSSFYGLRSVLFPLQKQGYSLIVWTDNTSARSNNSCFDFFGIEPDRKANSINPIYQYSIDNYKKYGIECIRSELSMLGLLNILEAYGENLDSLHNTDGYDFCDVFFCNTHEELTDSRIAEAVLECNMFYRHIDDLICTESDVCESWEEVVTNVKEALSNDEDLVKTTDGYVKKHLC